MPVRIVSILQPSKALPEAVLQAVYAGHHRVLFRLFAPARIFHPKISEFVGCWKFL